METAPIVVSGQTRPMSPRLVEVLRVRDVTPQMRRITLGGEEMRDYPSVRQGAHVKLFFPRPGQEAPALPTFGEDGPRWPPDKERPFSRPYTVRHMRTETGEMDLDFFLHDPGGPATEWALRAAPGAKVGISGPGGREIIPRDAGQYLFVGDESAIAAIAAHLESLPQSVRGLALIEVSDKNEEQTLETPEGVRIEWLLRNGKAPGRTTNLIDAVRSLTWLEPEATYAWVAGEETAVKAIRAWLRFELGFARGAMHTKPYWKVGCTEEAYHDERHHFMDANE